MTNTTQTATNKELSAGLADRAWPRYCRKVYWTKMAQNGPNDHFGQNGLIPNWILALARPLQAKMVHFGPFWPEEVHFGPFRSASRTLAIPERKSWKPRKSRKPREFRVQTTGSRNDGFRNARE